MGSDLAPWASIDQMPRLLELTYRFGLQKCAINNLLTRLIGKDNPHLLRREGDRSGEAQAKQDHWGKTQESSEEFLPVRFDLPLHQPCQMR
jgi:hypothetical protein